MKLKIFYQLKTRSPFLLIESKSAKKYSARRWFVDMTNLWHNGFRKLLTTYEKKYEDYLSCTIGYKHNYLHEDNFGTGPLYNTFVFR